MSSKPRAVFLDFATVGPDVDTKAIDRLVAAEYFDFSEAADIPTRLRDCEIAIVNKALVGRTAIAGADALRLIVLCATGADNVDVGAAREHRVGVANTRDYCSTAVAQHVFALILGLTQQLAPYEKLVRSGAWGRSRSFALFDYPIRELAGRALGIVGYGSLGRAVGRLGEALGMRLLISARPDAGNGAEPGRVPFDVVLREADVVTLHCPLTEATQHLIATAELEAMRSDAILINTARGGLVDGEALARALKAGEIAGAGIDVLPVEPPPDDAPLLKPDVPNLILTPHIAWAAKESRQRALDQVAENIEAFLAGRRLRRLV